jgi:hypothetical protein
MIVGYLSNEPTGSSRTSTFGVVAKNDAMEVHSAASEAQVATHILHTVRVLISQPSPCRGKESTNEFTLPFPSRK